MWSFLIQSAIFLVLLGLMGAIIMSDHQGFNDVLKDMGKSGYGDNRQYGNYGD